jgi:hypothetical protein
MAIAYHVYSNHGTGGPVDDSSPIVTTTDLTCVVGPLAPSSDTTFLVRAYDTSTGLEEANTEASVRVVLGPDGTDRSGVPDPPHAVSLVPTAGGGCAVRWAYNPSLASRRATGFLVYVTQGGAVDYSTPAATVAFTPGRAGYSVALPGPYTPSQYTAAVRAFNDTGTETNALFVTAFLGTPAADFVMDPISVRFT